jgi:hypothetical protein
VFVIDASRAVAESGAVIPKGGKSGVAGRVRSLFSYAYWVALALIFGRGLWLRFCLPSTPIADADTWGYLSPAMGQLIGTGWAHHLRNYLYPGFLFVLLRTFNDFRVITVAQHLLGMAAGGLFLVVWWRMRDFVARPRVPREIHVAIGLAAVAIYLFAPEPMRFETDIRPEGILSFLVILNIWLVLEFVWRCWVRRIGRMPLVFGWAAVCSAIVLSLARPSFAIAAAGGLVPVAIGLFGQFPARKKFVLVLGSVVVAGVLLVPERFLARGDDAAETFLPTELFMIHAAIIRHQMAVDVASGAVLPYPTDWLRGTEWRLAEEITKSAKHPFPTLGLHPDYLMFRQDSFDAGMRRDFRGRLDKLCDFYRFYYKRAWREQPKRMLEKIWRQMLVFYAVPCPAYRLSRTWRIAEEYAGSRDALANIQAGVIWASYPPLITFIANTDRWARTGLVLQVPSGIWKWERFLAVGYVPCLTVAVTLGAYVLLRRTLRRRLGLLAALVIVLYWYNFANCFEIAIVHSLDNHRYCRAQLIFTILAQAATFLFTVVFALEAAASLRKSSALAGIGRRFRRGWASQSLTLLTRWLS